MKTLINIGRVWLIQSIVILFLPFVLSPAYSQNPARFQSEIDQFKKDTTDYSVKNPLVLFTGSSTIRLWPDLQKDFPDLAVLNRGFGGSCMSDLIYYADTLILQYRPEMIFIYEGDNDLATGRTPKEIIAVAGQLISLIRKELPNSAICFIAAKPSISRWNLRKVYQDYNQQLRAFTRHLPNIYYLDMWHSMLGPGGKPRTDIFLEDGLHMNRQGYDIWKKRVAEFLRRHPVRGKA
jgi:lysophospholipase L1-like esterase